MDEVLTVRQTYLVPYFWSCRGEGLTAESGWHSSNIQKRLASRTKHVRRLEWW